MAIRKLYIFAQVTRKQTWIYRVFQEKKSGQDPTHAWARSQKFESNGMRIRTAGRRMGKIEYKQVQSDPAHLLNIRDMDRAHTTQEWDKSRTDWIYLISQLDKAIFCGTWPSGKTFPSSALVHLSVLSVLVQTESLGPSHAEIRGMSGIRQINDELSKKKDHYSPSTTVECGGTFMVKNGPQNAHVAVGEVQQYRVECGIKELAESSLIFADDWT
ncbi:hypothetical protein C8J57DRAFT_1227105 [Mycena rebaudengoi]|nr:hypothetical protein C8J57DRAFT_1227105 [Mycena rebaudengoi]